MNMGLPMFQFAVLAAGIFAVIGAGLCAIAYPLLRRIVLTLSPNRRARVLLVWSMAPLVLSGVLTLLCILPLGLSLVGCVDNKHIVISGDGYTHFCLAHPHLVLNAESLGLISMVLSGLLLLVMAMQSYRWWGTRRLLDVLVSTSCHERYRGVRVLECGLPLALTAGLMRPEIFISSRLLAALPAEMLVIILAHERAHVRRRDGLMQFVAHVCALLHFPWVRRTLLADLSLACEQACDEEAARGVGDRLRVAETLLAIERLFRPSDLSPTLGTIGTLSFSDANTVDRIEALLSAPKKQGCTAIPRLLSLGLLPLLFSATVFAAEPAHRLIEAILGLLAR
jgi:Zn-dependent protease with chaperone function